MQYPPEFVTALMTVSTAFMAIAGVIIAIFANKDEKTRLNRENWSIGFCVGSTVAGIVCMVTAMNWFGIPTDDGLNAAKWATFVQFALLYVPLLWIGISVFPKKQKK